MKIITALFMAWGNFTVLPCPYKRWDNELKNYMLSFLPAIGMLIGGIWVLILRTGEDTIFSYRLLAIIMTVYIFIVTGFFHLDGFMDCSDAILSRRDMAEKQRILKDSNVGAFAVISVCLLILAFYSSMFTAIPILTNGELFVVPVVSRACGGLWVLTFKPIGHSQYADTYDKDEKTLCIFIILGLLAFAVGIAGVVALDFRSPLKVTLLMTIVSLGTALYAKKQLGGMSGDIAGYTICLSELAGIFYLALGI